MNIVSECKNVKTHKTKEKNGEKVKLRLIDLVMDEADNDRDKRQLERNGRDYDVLKDKRRLETMILHFPGGLFM